MSSSFALGVAAAILAPFVMTLGLFVWDNYWTGSSYALNLVKCCLASSWFLLVSIATRATTTTSAAPGASALFPPQIFTIDAVGFLFLSSVLGILIGDILWIEALRLLGPRRVIVVDMLKPFLAALMGWIILGEKLKISAMGGIFLTVVGVVIVSLERTAQATSQQEIMAPVPGEMEHIEENKSDGDQAQTHHEDIPLELFHESNTTESDANQSESCSPCSMESWNTGDATPSSLREEQTNANGDQDALSTRQQTSLRDSRTNTMGSLRRGYGFSFLNVFLDTYASVLTKQWGSHMTIWEVSMIRFGFAGAIMLVCSIVLSLTSRQMSFMLNMLGLGDQESTWYKLPNNMTRSAWFKTISGVALVTFLTPALSNYALFQVALALALTLGSIGPLYALMLGWILQYDKPTLLACVGVILAIGGVILLSIFGSLE